MFSFSSVPFIGHYRIVPLHQKTAYDSRKRSATSTSTPRMVWSIAASPLPARIIAFIGPVVSPAYKFTLLSMTLFLLMNNFRSIFSKSSPSLRDRIHESSEIEPTTFPPSRCSHQCKNRPRQHQPLANGISESDPQVNEDSSKFIKAPSTSKISSKNLQHNLPHQHRLLFNSR